MVDADRYSITVRKVDVDGEPCFRADVRELPDVTSFASTYEEARSLAVDAINTLASVAERKGKPFPLPIAEEEIGSGRVTLRLPRSLHSRITENARREDVSLNTYIVSLISYAAGALQTVSLQSVNRAHPPRTEGASLEIQVIKGAPESANVKMVGISAPDLTVYKRQLVESRAPS